MRVLALALLLISGCNFEPNEAEAIPPFPEYLALWDSAQACTHRLGNFNDLRFFIVPDVDSFPDGEGGYAAGETVKKNIYIAEGYEHSHLVIKHEMIHALGFHHGHPATPFETPCHATWSSYHGEY